MNHSENLGGKRLLGTLLALLLAGPPVPVRADDTELYFADAPPDAPAPLVMLTLDWRPNLGSTYCSDASDASCRDSMGQDIYDALDLEPKSGELYSTTQKVNLFETFRAVFRLVFEGGAFDGMKVGFMMSHDNSCTGKPPYSNCSNGGYVLRGFELFEKDDPNDAKEELLEILAAIPTNVPDPDDPDNEKGTRPEHKYQGRELFFELYRYLAGLDVLNGKLGYTDFDGSPGGGQKPPARNLDFEFSKGFGALPTKCKFTTEGGNSGDNRLCEDYIDLDGYKTTTPLPSNLTAGTSGSGGTPPQRISSALTWDPDIITTSDRYISPFKDSDKWACSGVFSINMLFQVSQQDADSDDAIAMSLEDQGLDLSSSGTDKEFPPMIAKLHNMDIAAGQAAGVPNVAGTQSLTSFFLVDKVNTKTDEYAEKGGTHKAIAALSDPRGLLEALENVAGQINSVSSTYVAVTVPVNSDNRVTSLPNLFVALFQVDENGKPLWPGNLKKLDVVTSTDPLDGSKRLDVKDALGNPAFNPITGRIDDNALTLWTVPGADDVVAADTSKLEVSGSDGSSVMRGGAGHKTPGYRSGSVGEKNVTGARQIFLEPESFLIDPLALAGNDLDPLDASDDSALLKDEDVQTRFGFRDTACDDPPDSTYCLSAIKEVLDAAEIPYPTPPSGLLSDTEKDTMAQEATQALLRWIRGFDVFNEAGASGSPNGLTTTAQRKWLMGDVLHSRPVAINYGARVTSGTDYSKDNQDVRLVFGANDGLLRMVRNTMPGADVPGATTQQGDEYGQEVWAFMPRELLGHVRRLATTGNVGLNRPYGVDGEPTLFTIDTNRDGIINNGRKTTVVVDPDTGEPVVDPDTGEPSLVESDVACYSVEGVGDEGCDRAWVYFGLRRGGKSYYAIDVSNPDAAAPKLLWKIDDSMADFTELGLTFSTPRVGWVRFEDGPANPNQFNDPDDDPDEGFFNVPVPVVIVGGGYHGHALEAGDHHVSGADSKDKLSYFGDDAGEGNAVFIIHARTGQLIWKVTGGTGTDSATHSFHAEMKHGFAAAVAPMDADGDNILDRLYAPDTGGRLWRIDLPQFVPEVTPGVTRAADWRASLFADLRPADATLASSTDDDLRFFHAATIVRRAKDDIGDGYYDAIAVGSGDREHPQSETNKNNWFFLFKDRLTTSGDPAVAARASLAPADLLNITDICLNVEGGGGCTGDLTHGWRLALEATGEKNLSTPFIGGNGIIFTTYLPEGTTPEDDPCSPMGTSRLYQVGLEAGQPLRFLHTVVGNTFSKTDRWINLYSGIDGGVVAVSPDFWITATGYSGENPPQKPIQFYWRESGVDEVK